MNLNLGNIDRILRVIIGLGIYAAFILNYISGGLAAVLVSLGTVFLLTGFAGICPLYKIFKLSTFKFKHGL